MRICSQRGALNIDTLESCGSCGSVLNTSVARDKTYDRVPTLSREESREKAESQKQRAEELLQDMARGRGDLKNQARQLRNLARDAESEMPIEARTTCRIADIVGIMLAVSLIGSIFTIVGMLFLPAQHILVELLIALLAASAVCAGVLVLLAMRVRRIADTVDRGLRP